MPHHNTHPRPGATAALSNSVGPATVAPDVRRLAVGAAVSAFAIGLLSGVCLAQQPPPAATTPATTPASTNAAPTMPLPATIDKPAPRVSAPIAVPSSAVGRAAGEPAVREAGAEPPRSSGQSPSTSAPEPRTLISGDLLMRATDRRFTIGILGRPRLPILGVPLPAVPTPVGAPAPRPYSGPVPPPVPIGSPLPVVR